MKKVKLLISALAMSAVLMPEVALAYKASEGTLRGVRNASNQTRDGINAMRGDLVDGINRWIAALMQSTGENSAYTDKAIEAQKRLMDAAEMNQTNRMRQEFRAKAESGAFDPDPGICLIAGLFGGGDAPPETTKSLGTTLASSAAAKASGADPAVVAGGTTLAKSIDDDRKKMTEALGVPDPTANPAILVINPTIASSTDPTASAAIERLIRNMTDPNPPKPVTAAEAETPEGKGRAAKRAIQLTRAYTGQEAIAMVINMRSEVGEVNDEWKAYVDDIAGYNRPVGNMMSELQGIDIRTLRYYAPSENMIDQRNTASEKALMQQMVDQQAIANRIAYLQLELDSRRALVETQILSTLAN